MENDRPTPSPGFDDEGGLRAPSNLKGWRKAWWWFDFIVLVKLARLRFIAVLFIIGVIITQWDTLAAYYDKWTRPTDASASVAGDVEWFCPMHPSVVRNNGKEKCPICFMPLSKRKKGSATEEVLPAGTVNRVQLSPYRVVLAGVQTWPIEYQPLVKEISAVGFVEFNERGERGVSARSKGRIDKLFVNETGQMVDEGDVLASLYSPELNVTMQNLLDAKRNRNPELLASARTRLQLLGIGDDQIDEIVATGTANSHLKIRSPISGHVIRKFVREGDYVEEGSPLYQIADLSTVWIQAQVYEDDLAFLPVEQSHKAAGASADAPEVTATTRSFPSEPFRGKLAFVYPHVDQDTRTVAVRCELANPGHKLRPGTTATVRIHIPANKVPSLVSAAQGDDQQREHLAEGRVLAVPELAVIDTGSQRIVYREVSPGVFEGTLVELGPKMMGLDQVVFYPVLKGLKRGDRIVTAGSFLVDAETRLNPAAGSIYFGGSGGNKSGSPGPTIRPSTPEDPNVKVQASLAALSEEDRRLVAQQRFCPVISDSQLGSMGTPVKLTVEGQPVFVCCDGCKAQAFSDPTKTLAQVTKLKRQATTVPPAASNSLSGRASTIDDRKAHGDPQSEAALEVENEVRGALAKLSSEDRAIAIAQKFCAVLPKSRLGSMGVPPKLMIEGQPVFLCCEHCRQKALADPKATLESVKKLKEAAQR